MIFDWSNILTLTSRDYICGYCGNPIASEKGWYANHRSGLTAYVYVCHKCGKPTFFDINEEQTPGTSFGNDIENIDDESVKDLYKEMRGCMSVSSYTPAVLAARKLLMHIAVSKGAKEGQKFAQYVEYLAEKNFIPPGSEGWVDHIRDKGNEANHEIVLMLQEDARDLISFIEMLLRLIYEFPARIKAKNQDS